MSTTLTIELPVHFQRCGPGSRRELRSGTETPSLPPGRVPRVARLMALALRLDALVRSGPIRTYSELASLGQVTRARVCQIMRIPGENHPRIGHSLGAPGGRNRLPEIPRLHSLRRIGRRRKASRGSGRHGDRGAGEGRCRRDECSDSPMGEGGKFFYSARKVNLLPSLVDRIYSPLDLMAIFLS
jgi:hypothetical protein